MADFLREVRSDKQKPIEVIKDVETAIMVRSIGRDQASGSSAMIKEGLSSYLLG